MSRFEIHHSLIGSGGKMKKLWPLQLIFSMSIVLLAFSLANAAVSMVQITACIDCHGTNPQTNVAPVEGTVRNTPARATVGSHAYHVNTQALTCAGCHVVPTAMNHRDGKINMAASMSGGVTYSTAVAGVVTQNNQTGTTGHGTCSGTSCHSSGASPVWGTVSNCETCHGYPPVTTAADPDNLHQGTAVNHIGTGATVNTKATFVSVHGGCQICHGTQSSTGLGTDNVQAPHANYVVTAQHATGNINMNGPVGTGTGYDSTISGCTAACHASTAPYRMTASGKTITYGNYGTGGDCISCHTVAQPSPVATALDATVTSRPPIAGNFSLTQSHTRSRTSKTATKEDCCVCHMEGDVATGSPNGAYHKNGYVELRDPDLGTTIKAVTHSGTTAAQGAYASGANDAKFVRFKRNLGIMLENESAVVYTGVTNFQVIGGIMVNHCLKCHDSNGATSTTAQIPTTGSAFKPFGATVAANGTNQGVLDVAAQFASTNRAQHPVLIKNNNNFTNTGGTRLVAPWNASVTKTGSSVANSATVYGALISCWDCHAKNGSTAATTLVNTNAAVVLDTHGITKTVTTDAVELRGSVYLSSTTTAGNLCLNCHVVSGGTTLHGTGSAMATSSSNNSMTYFQNRCYFCHSGVETNAHAARPIGAGDAHGYNTTSTGAAITTGGKGYAFIRRTGLGQIVKAVGATSYTTTCGSGTGICTQGMGTYAPGGVF
jgi:predicted CxxxxCH...CXXCH cytochrome family protein